jgi:hypothetical protein
MSLCSKIIPASEGVFPFCSAALASDDSRIDVSWIVEDHPNHDMGKCHSGWFYHIDEYHERYSVAVCVLETKVTSTFRAAMRPICDVIYGKKSSVFCGDGLTKGNINSLRWLFATFGTHRVARCLRASYLSYISNVNQLASLCTHLECISKEDMEDLLHEIHRSKIPYIRSILEKDLVRNLHYLFSHKTLESCSADEIQILERILLPFSSKEQQLFLIKPSETSVKSVAVARQKLREKIEKESISQEAAIAFIRKHFARSNIPNHMIIPTPNGYFTATPTDHNTMKFTPLGEPRKPMRPFEATILEEKDEIQPSPSSYQARLPDDYPV